MTVRTIIRMGHPHLRRLAQLMTKEEILSDETLTLIQDMEETMQAASGIGLAAPQIDVDKQLALIRIDKDNSRYPNQEAFELLVIINPKITILDPTPQTFWEGCLSVPGLRGAVKRPRGIQVDYLDQKGQAQSIKAFDFLATVFQHELDHLFGKLYIDRIEDPKNLSFDDEFKQFVLPESEDEVLDD